MFQELNNILKTTPETCEQGISVLLCDKQTDGSFLVHHFLSFYLKANFTGSPICEEVPPYLKKDLLIFMAYMMIKLFLGFQLGGCKVCFLGLLQSFSHYSLVAQKLGVNLSAAREKGQLVFLEGLRSSLDLLLDNQQDSSLHEASPLQFLSSPNASLRSLYDFVCTSVQKTSETAWKFPVLIIDDLSVLLSLGVTTKDILNFMHYCRATLCSKLKGNLVALVHDTEDLEDEENDFVVKSLSYQSHLILQAEGLATGYCKDIHGELKIIWRSLSPVKAEKNVTKIFQYKIQDKNVAFFARGTSAAVL